MERETSVLHLLTEHPIILFILGGLIVVALILAGMAILGKNSRRGPREPDKNE